MASSDPSELSPLVPVELEDRAATELALRFHTYFEQLAGDYGVQATGEPFDPQSPRGRMLIVMCRCILEDMGIT